MKNIFAKLSVEQNVINQQSVNAVLYEILNCNSGCHAV